MTDGDIEQRLDELESHITDQQTTIQKQRELIKQQRERIEKLEADSEDGPPESESPSASLASRRDALKAGGLLALLFGGAGAASADPQGQVGTSSDPLSALYTASLHAGDAGDVTLGDTLDLDGNALEDAGTPLWDAANEYVPQGRLENESLAVAGDNVSLGGSTEVAHGDLNNVSAGDHHTRPSAGNALADNSNTFEVQEDNISHDNIANVNSGDHHTKPSAGSGLTGTDTFDVNTDATLTVSSDQVGVASGGIGTTEIASSAVAGTELDLSTVAGDNITADTTNDELDADGSVTVAGNSVSLGGSTGVNYVDLGDTGSSFPVPGSDIDLPSLAGENITVDTPNNELDADGSVTVAGNSVSLGGSTGVAHDDLSNSNEDSHHTRPSAGTGLSDDSNTFKIVPGDFDGEYLSSSGTTLDFDGAAEWNGGGSNTASGDNATVGGGKDNTANNNGATVGGGKDNTASSSEATVGGGLYNTASENSATVGGGSGNTASVADATVGGGSNNTAGGSYATVPGGYGNTANSDASFAAGSGNSIGSGQNNCFVFGQSVDLEEDGDDIEGDGRSELIVFSPSSGEFDGAMGGEAQNQVLSDAPIYAPLNDTSSRTLKTNIETVDARSILTKVRNMEISKWEFIDIDTGRHIGPMAEDFHDAFAVGDDEKSIASVDADGVALAAIQGLSEQVDEKDDRIDALEAENDDLRAENEALRERVAAIEAELGIDAQASQQTVAND